MASNDKWTTVTKNSKRCARTRKRGTDSGFSKSSKRRQLDHDTLDSSSRTLSLNDINQSLQGCLQEVRESDFFKTFKESLKRTIQSSKEPISEIVCYGFGNFGESKCCAPMYQLAFAVVVREILSSNASASNIESIGNCCSHGCHTSTIDLLPMYFYDPCMTQEESIVLERHSVQVITENERGRRRVHQKTLFLMPHCPLALYSNLIHSNWDQLYNVVIFGNLLSVYASRLGGVKSSVKLLQQVEPFWNESALPISKKDLSDRSGHFEQAFNDSSLTCFQMAKGQELFQLPPPTLTSEDDGGETI